MATYYARVVVAGAIFALAMMPTQGGAEDWFDARAEAILDAAIKAECEDYCLTDHGCYQRCFDAKYEEVLYEWERATWQQRDSWLDILAKKLRPELMSPRAKEAERRAKAQGECRRAAYQANEARETACYAARKAESRRRSAAGSSDVAGWSAANRALGDCMKGAREANNSAGAEAVRSYPIRAVRWPPNACEERTAVKSVKEEKDVNLPDALKNIAGAVEALNDAINEAEADPNLSDTGKDLVTAVEDIL